MPDPVPAPANPSAAPGQTPPPAPAPAAAAAGAGAGDGTTPPAPAEGGKTPDGKPAVTPPAELKLTLPDKSPLAPARLEKIVSYAKERGLSPEAAQELATREHEVAVETLAAQEAAFAQARKVWREQSEKHPEFGGEKLGKNVELAKRVSTRFGGPEFTKFLDDTGFGDHPAVLGFLVRVGASAGDDTLNVPGAKPAGAPKKSLAEVFSPALSGDGKP